MLAERKSVRNMGMAASQARFLGLTARKNNVEFEGQQINQQRTTLSNQSANYYNDLLGMAVPTPPSVDSYTKTVYTFTDGALTNSITTMIAQNDASGKYTVSYLSQWEDDFAPVAAATSVVNVAGGKYMVGSTELRALGVTPNAATIAADEYLSSLDTAQLTKLIEEEAYYIELLNKKYPKYNGSDWYVRYVENSATGTYTPYFYNKLDLDGTPDANGNIVSSVSCYTIGSETRTNEIKGVKDCMVEKDSTGRYISITIPDAGTGNGTTYRLTTSTVTDQDAYDDAMNQYEYEKYQYDQAIEEINAKIAIIQAQDKNLELRLKQLDTEQNAISTEVDAVQQVIEKNTESSFKTFG
ncbi:hypothetical protein IJZ97_01860 [bacterium]|nr:hypothetical protein [bacterium]